MIGVELTSTDVWTLVAIVSALLAALAFLAMAETVALNRISKVKAQAMAEATGSRLIRAGRLASQPERFLNALLVTVTICQTAQAFPTSILAARLFGTIGVIVAFILNVIVFFVLAEASRRPARCSTPSAATISTPITSALVRFRRCN